MFDDWTLYQCRLRKTAAKKPSAPSFCGNIFMSSPFSTSRLCRRQKSCTCSQFSCLRSEQVMQRSLPCRPRYLMALPTICCCKRTLLFSQDSLNFSLISGLRRKVPVPVQGASTITQSILPVAIRPSDSYPLWNCTLVTPARLKRRLALPRATSLGSCTKICPVFWRRWAIARDLPPLPPQQSRTSCPGRTSALRAASCDPSS